MNECVQQELSISPSWDSPSQSTSLLCVPSSQQIPWPRSTGPLLPPSQSKRWALEGHAHGRSQNAQSGAHSCPTCPSEPARSERGEGPRFRFSAALRAYLAPCAQDLPRPRLYTSEQRVLDHAQHDVTAVLRTHQRTLGGRDSGGTGATGANPRWQRESRRQGWAPPAPPRRTARIGAGSGRSALAREGAGEPRSSSSRLRAEVLGAALVWGPEALGCRSSSAGPCLCPESGLFAEGLQTDCPLYRIWAAAVENFLPHLTHPYFCPRPRPLSGTWAPNSGISRFLEGCPGPPP